MPRGKRVSDDATAPAERDEASPETGPASRAEEPETCAPRGPTPADARRLLTRWLDEIGDGGQGCADEAQLRTAHGDDLERIEWLWADSYPGREARRLLRETLRTLLAERAAARRRQDR
ncbi:MAG: hypothetical protein GF330_05540 [Candidatus Eisenbacteria bacterium]|nr:hypothetical protein [Candidatus Eisenbacteria bacterium]